MPPLINSSRGNKHGYGPVLVENRNGIIKLKRFKHVGIPATLFEFTMTPGEVPMVIRRMANLVGMKAALAPLDDDGDAGKFMRGGEPG